MSAPRNYPWYERIETGDELDQGDILFDCPIIQIDESAQWPLPAVEFHSLLNKATLA